MTSFIETLNHWGDHFLNFTWPMLWQSSLLIAIIFVLDLALRRKIRAAIRYALWLIVLVKLLLPPSLALPTSLAWWLLPSPIPPPKPQTTAFVVTYGDQPAPVFPQQFQPAPVPIPPKMSAAAWSLAASGVVSAGLLAWLLVRWRQINQKVRRANAPEKLIPILDEARRITHSPPGFRLKLTEDSMSPAVCGLFRPVILLPQSLVEKLSAGQLRAVLLHEAIHLRRGDVWVNCAQALLQIFYWWHPLLWLANARIRRVREEAVDDAVMLALRDDAEIYASTLLEVAKLAFNRPLAGLGLVGILESRSALRQRIERLINFRAPRKAGLTIVSILGILAFTAVALPMGEAPGKTNAEAVSLRSDTPISTNVPKSVFKTNTSMNMVTGLLSNPNFRATIHALEQRTGVESLAEPETVTTSGQGAQRMRTDYVLQQTQYASVTGGDLSTKTNAARSEVTRVFRIDQPMKEDELKKHLLEAGVKIPPTVLVYSDSGILLARGSEEQLALVDQGVMKLNRFSLSDANRSGKQKVVMDGANPAATNLEMRVFKVDPRTFAAGLRGIPGLQANSVATMAESLFDKLGVDLTAHGRSVAYMDKSGLLYVRATASELDTLECVVQVLNQAPPQIHIKARFIEIEQANNNSLGFDWYLGNFTNNAVTTNGVSAPVSAGNPPGTFPGNSTTSAISGSPTDQQLVSGLRNTAPAPATVTGILTDPNFRMTLHALESRPRTTILAEPEAVTISGRQVQMRATDIMTVLTNINPLALKPPGVSSNELFLTQKVECGPVFDVVPYVLSDGYTINLAAFTTLLEFLGYDKPTNSVTVYIDGKKQTVPVPLPKFHTQKISTVVNLWDNQTLVLGGPVTLAVQITKDKVPLLGDLPLVGGLFRSQTENSVKKQLMVFVTATIVDPAGNRAHSDDELPSNPPPQPPINSFNPSR
jgi:type II secretory pathway component GspD/PulD (secretin)/beta-lactamase regulating signal transducer with metallopeptidase domain